MRKRGSLKNAKRVTVVFDGHCFEYLEKNHKDNYSEAIEKAYKKYYNLDIQELEVNKIFNKIQRLLEEQTINQKKLDELNEIYYTYKNNHPLSSPKEKEADSNEDVRE